MQVKFTMPAAALLFRMFFNVESLNADSNGATKFPPFSAADEIGAAEVGKISKWLRTKVFTANESGGFNVREWEGKVRDNYVKRIVQIVKHYEGAGRLITNCEAYCELLMGLEGKDPDTLDIEG